MIAQSNYGAALPRPGGLGAVDVDDDDSRSYGERIVCDDQELDLVECRDTIARYLHGLPPDRRQIVLMRFDEDLTQSEIGARIGLSQISVSRLPRRALEHMKLLAAAPLGTGAEPLAFHRDVA